MYERFTERASKVLMLAKKEAVNMSYPYIGTEHLLLGLILEGESLAAKVLGAVGLEPEGVRAAVRRIVEQSQERPSSEPVLTAKAKMVVEKKKKITP